MSDVSRRAAKPPTPGPGITLSRLRRPDPDLLLVLESYDLEAFGPTGLSAYDLTVMAEAGAVFVAELQGDVVGSCQVMRMLDEPGFLYVVGFYIRPRWQGKGLGRAFLSAVAAESREMGACGLVLTVAPDNTRALSLYRSAGFVDEAFIPKFYGQEGDRHVLRWRFPEGDLPVGV